MRKRILSVLLILILSLGYSVQVCATTVDEVREEQEKTQEQLDELNDRMEGMEQQKDAVAGEITVLDTQLVDILTSISICEDEIAAKEDEIDLVKVELEEAEEREQTQYEDMKTRIRFMYEKGDQAYLQIFLEASSLPEMLNKANYVEKLYEYDRELLQEYEATKLEVAGIKEELEMEEADLLTSQKELKEQQDYLENVIAEKRATVANFDAQLAQAQQEATSYKQQLKSQNEQIRRLEEEERERQKQKEKEEQNAANTNVLASNSTGNNAQNNQTTTQQPEVVTDVNSVAAGSGDDSSLGGTSSAGSGLGQQIASYGQQFLGNPYVYGGTSLTNGTDCSGFTQAVYAHFGIRIPRDSTSQRFAGTGVSYAEAMPGDIICYAGHVGIYIGNGQIVHASTERTGIKISNATYRTILAVRRIV
ncbi:MAG: C40 family peptidase [Lachnospiraceae bacterium]|nr:C40 family peptidase [Lachnospiraceae bacterium]